MRWETICAYKYLVLLVNISTQRRSTILIYEFTASSHLELSQLKSSTIRRKSFIRSTQTYNITNSFFISNWLFCILLKNTKLEILFLSSFQLWTLRRKERRSWFFSKSCRLFPTTASKAVKTLFLLSWSENSSLLLQTLAENRVSAFLYPLLFPELVFWIGEPFT